MRRLLAGLAAVLAASMLNAADARAEPTREQLREGRSAARVCASCHHFKRANRKFGPHLVDLIGRPVASAKNYAYSDALKALGGVWTEDRLVAYLNDPAAFAPGTAMKFEGYKDMAKARAAVAYLVERYYAK